MDENPYSYQQLFGSLPPEYRMWYTTQLLMYNNNGHNENSESDWPARRESTQETDNVPPCAFQSEMANGENLPDQAEQTDQNVNQWNYLYYLQMLAEMEQERSRVTVESTAQDVTAATTRLGEEEEERNELYSAKVKKGLKSKNHVFRDFQTTSDQAQVSGSKTSPELSAKIDKTKNKSVQSNKKKKTVIRDDLGVNEHFKSHGSNATSEECDDEFLYCNSCESCSSPVLNNSFIKVPCPSGNKCLLNVNNNLQRKAQVADEPVCNDSKTPLKEKSRKGSFEGAASANINSSEKPTRSSLKSRKLNKRSTQQDDDDMDGSVQDLKSAKKRNVGSKNKCRVERGKMPRHSQRKRHADTERESSMDNVFAALNIVTATLRQLPSQPWFKYTLDSLTSLVGVIIGSLLVLAYIVWEGLVSGYKVLIAWLLRAAIWIRINGSSLAQIVFLHIPGLTGSVKTETNTKSGDPTQQEQLPSNGDDAVRRLLHLKGQDPYSILGITPAASDEEIKRRYKSQAVLVHPDKNHYSGAEEAFKVLASAFDILGNLEKRTEYDQEHNLKKEGDEITSFLEKIQKNIEEMQSILGCQSCGKNHKRYKTDRQADSARYCGSCKTFHAAREGDLWAETTMLGFKWHYYAYLDKAIFDITEWVTCQTDLITTVEANSHSVTCRLATKKGGKNRNGAYSRMQDLKDLVNDLLTKSRQPHEGSPTADKTKTPNNNGEGSRGNKTRRHGGGLSGGSRKRK